MHGPREVTFYMSLFGDEATELPPDIQQLKYCATDLLGRGRGGEAAWSKALCNGLKVQHIPPVLFPGVCHLPSIFDWLQYPKAEREGLRYLITKPGWIPVEFSFSLSKAPCYTEQCRKCSLG